MKTSPTTTGEHMFEVLPNKERNIFDKDEMTAFHHSVAHFLFGTPRGRKDIQTSIDLPKKWVREPYEDDWYKIRQILRYPQVTI